LASHCYSPSFRRSTALDFAASAPAATRFPVTGREIFQARLVQFEADERPK
jgi:hypothetical protein